jgi:hypothetical protein
MKKQNYKKPDSIWRVTNRTKRLETSYKGWDQPPKKTIQPPTKRKRWVSRLNNTLNED